MAQDLVLQRIETAPALVLLRVDASTPGGGGPGTGDPPGDVPDLRFPVGSASAPPVRVTAFWSDLGATAIEGESVVWELRLSSTVDGITYIPVVLTGTVDQAQVTWTQLIRILPGRLTQAYIVRTTDAAAAGSTRTAIFTLDPSGAYVDPADPGEPLEVEYILDVDPAVGPDVITLTIVNSVPPATAEWEFGVGVSQIAIPEGFGNIGIPVVLDIPSTTDVRVRVQSSGGTGVAGRDYVALDEIVTIPQGEVSERVTLTVLDNTLVSAVDLTVDIVGTLVSGDAVDGALTTFEVVMIDNDGPGGGGGGGVGVHELNWLTQTQAIVGGTQLTVTVAVVDSSLGTPRPFSTITDVPILISGVDAAEWTINWQGNPPGFLRFPVGQGGELRFFTITAPGDMDLEDEDVVLTIGQAPAGEWAVGTPASITITALDQGGGGVTNEAKLMVPSHRSVGGGEPRRMIQGLAAVVPPSPVSQLPNYSLSTGETVQVVRMSMTNETLVDSVHFYGFDSGAESMPNDQPGLTLRPTVAGDAAPPEAGIFTAAPSLDFQLSVANGTNAYVCGSNNGVMLTEAWTGPTSPRFAQTGPEVVRETSYLARPHLVSATGPQKDLLSGDACGMIDWCVKQIAGDADVLLVEGRFINATYDSAEDVHATNTKSDGTINVEDLLVTTDVGWVIDPGPYTHSAQQSTPGQTVELISLRSTSYLMRPAQRYGFWFVLRRASAGVAAQERGQDYRLSRNIAWAVGELGPTRQPIYGDNAVLTVDYDRLAFRNISGPNVFGWDAIRYIGENIGGTQTSFTGFGAAWAAGVPQAENRFQTRLGMWHFAGAQRSGPSGFSGSSPMGALIPWWGWWDRMRYMHEYGMQRAMISARDTTDGSAAWWWRALRPDGKVGMIGSIGYNSYRRKLWTQNYGGQYEDKNSATQRPGWARAPVDRVWNRPVILDGTLTLLSIGTGSLVINEAIPVGTPVSGTLIVTTTGGWELGYSYSSWAGSTFTGDGEWATPPNESFAAGSSVKTSTGDIDWSNIDRYATLAVTHLGYLRAALNDGWYCMRRYNEFRDWEELTASISRGAVPTPNVSADADGGHSTTNKRHCYGGIMAMAGDVTYGLPWKGSGEFVASNTYSASGVPGQNRDAFFFSALRGYGRQLQFLSGFSAIAGLVTRGDLLGIGEALTAYGPGATPWVANTIGRLWDVLEQVTTPSGSIGGRARGGSPNAYAEGTFSSQFTAPDFISRLGAWPSERTDYPQDIAAGQQNFHQAYVVAAMAGALARSIAITDPIGRFTSNERAFKWIEYIIQGREGRGFTADGFDNYPYEITNRIDDYPSASNASGIWTGASGGAEGRVPDVVSLARIQSGEYVWAFRRAGGGVGGSGPSEPFDYYGELHKWKASACGYYAARVLGDDIYIRRHVGKVFSRGSNTSAQDIVEYFVRSSGPLGSTSIEEQFSSDTGSTNQATYQYAQTSATMNMPLLAYLLNQYT